MEYGALLLWILVVLAIGAFSLPLVTWLFRSEDGAPFAVAVGIGIVTIVAHLVGQVAYGWPALIAGLAVLATGSVLAWQRVEPDWGRYGEATVVFLGAFLFIVAIRSVDPSAAPLPLAVGEKPLDFGILASLDRSATLPPEDVWFAGEPVAYHYGGHLATNLLSTFSGISPALAYNLGLATFYAMLATAAYGLAGAIVRPYDVSRRLAGGLGVVLVCLAANLKPLAQFLAWILPDGLVTWIVTQAGASPAYADWSPAAIDGFWYFGASRVIPVDPTLQNPYQHQAATEFPLFAWLNGDLHAHMMSQPYMLLLAGLGLVYWRLPEESTHRLVVLFGAIPPLAGLIGFINVFSLPTAGGLVAVVLFLAPGDPLGPVRERSQRANWLGPHSHSAIDEGRRGLLALVGAGIVVVLGLLWTLPFWLTLMTTGSSYQVLFWGRWSPLGSLLLVHGAFLAVFVPYLAAWLVPSFESPRLVALGGVGVFALAMVVGAPALGLFVPLGLLAWWLVRKRADAGYEFALLVAGAGLVVLVELLSLDGQRFNVIFKYYAHVWLFFAVAAAVGLARLASGLSNLDLPIGRRHTAAFGRVLLVLVVISTGVYAAVALPVHFEEGSPETAATGPTLDATAYIETEYPIEAPAIQWINQLDGQPNIVTQAPSGYRWYPLGGEGASAPASMTGVPTVLGRSAERLYRSEDAYTDRAAAVREIYTGEPERQRQLLERYNVSYVYVGPAERNAFADPITIDEFSGVSVAESFTGGVTIYEYDG